MLLSACLTKVEEKDRIETKFKFNRVIFMNYDKVGESIDRTGSAEGGMGTVDLHGTINVKQEKIIITFSEQNSIEEYKSLTDTVNIKDCFLRVEDNNYKDYEYRTDKGEFTVSINDQGEVFSISGNDWKDSVTFLKAD
jgi:hypothetical protein